jgi:hypothetical protein
MDFVIGGRVSTSAKDEIKRSNTELEGSQVRVYTGLERRSGQERRENHLSIFKMLFFNGIRQSVRRAEDRNCIVVFDRYKPSLFINIIIVLSLSLLDALLTLILLSQGARELNPVMRYFLSHGPRAFIFVKYGLTVLSVLIIVFVKEAFLTRYRIGTDIFLHIFAAFFGSVVVWEFYLLFI